jgi:DNA invertase Pin-like site-specific DNA recombinase
MKTTFDPFVKRNCYSYTRFSSSAQAEGDSYRRQIERAQKFCDDHKNLELNETRFEDLGVSGWTGENIEKGALGDFIAAVKAGKIPKGSCLLVENWDRFSRLKPMEAYNKVGEIINAGVDVVTLEDGKFHTAENYHDFSRHRFAGVRAQAGQGGNRVAVRRGG